MPVRSADSAAVVSGSRPTTTAACAVVDVSSASVVSNGKPTTTPAATTASPAQCRRLGTETRSASRHPPAMTAARTLRTATNDQAPKPSSPQAVAGKVREKAITPSAAWTVPERTLGVVAGEALTAIGLGAVALSCALMQERSSVGELANHLRQELNRYSPGGKLPSSRTLVERFRVSPVTVSRALAQLAAEGLVVTRPGSRRVPGDAPPP